MDILTSLMYIRKINVTFTPGNLLLKLCGKQMVCSRGYPWTELYLSNGFYYVNVEGSCNQESNQGQIKEANIAPTTSFLF